MNIKARIAKLEQRKQHAAMPVWVRIIVHVGETQEQALSRWMNETGKPKPEAIIFRVIV